MATVGGIIKPMMPALMVPIAVGVGVVGRWQVEPDPC